MSLWLVNPRTLRRPATVTRGSKIRHGPLIDLQALQQKIQAGEIDADDNHFWIATRSADSALNKLNWTTSDIAALICCLKGGHQSRFGDYIESVWCQTSSTDPQYAMCPCDAYSVCYDECTGRRMPRGSACEFYLKFSLLEEDVIQVVVVGCHLS